MKILLIHLGTQSECFIATSLIKGLKKAYNDADIYCVVKNTETESIFKYNKNIKKTYTIKNVPVEFTRMHFDKVINLHPDFSTEEHFDPKSTEKLGFDFGEGTAKIYGFLYERKKTNKNIFQLYYRLAGLKWRGEGYSFSYYPKARTKKYTTGIAVVNANLKSYVVDKLKLDLSKIWNIPYKKNIHKKLDEINRCPSIVTDDFFTLNLALYLRKNVYFLETAPINMQIELFGSGKIFKVPLEIVR
jgi:ADP-heptose:LPS heptosyltransferase